ncbi:amine oxidase [Salmonirosea aquatica]|uniref:amine oxidase n=1 Tax=Salmonirosea aquatica TaxID=2654236 RepID=UPI0035716C84
MKINNPFRSFWMGGYECTDQLNVHGNRVDFLHVNSHFEYLREDYALLGRFNMATVREGLRWSQVERQPYRYDFSTFEKMLEIGWECGIQQIWDLCHFGYPDDMTPLHPQFAPRFAALCRAFASYHQTLLPRETLIVTPINEVSFMSWLGGDVAGTSPYCRNNGWEVKYGLMRAYIAGVKALREVNPNIRILTTEPLVNVVPPFDATPEHRDQATLHHELQYQALDMLCGKICPELGGQPEYLDILGFNYYYNNQWETVSNFRLPWNEVIMDSRWRTLTDLLREAHLRYDRPLVLTETSHPGEDRAIWIERIAEECSLAIEENLPLWGICLYPVIDRPNWDNLDEWHQAGLWDVDTSNMRRILHDPSAEAMLWAQQRIQKAVRSAYNQRHYRPQNKGASVSMASKPWAFFKDLIN